MFHDSDGELALRPADLAVLAACSKGPCRLHLDRPRLDDAVVDAFGRLEILTNCGLLESLQRVEGEGGQDIWRYYLLTERGKGLLRWRFGTDALDASRLLPERASFGAETSWPSSIHSAD
jgi:hypothetical protein